MIMRIIKMLVCICTVLTVFFLFSSFTIKSEIQIVQKPSNSASLPWPFGGSKDITHECGDTVSFRNAEITIDNPTESFTVDRDYLEYTQPHAYVKVPITITAKKNIKFKAKQFGSKVVKEEKNSMPKKLKLKKGDTYKGILCLEWDTAGATSYSPGPTKVKCNKHGCKGVWKFSKQKKPVRLKDKYDVEGILPNTVVETVASVERFDFMGAASGNSYDRIATLRSNDGIYFQTIISGDNLLTWERYQENSKVKIKGIVQNITQESGGSEPITSRTLLVKIVEVR